MQHGDFLRDLIVLYGLAMVIAYLMRRLKQSTIVGYLVAGMVAGPSGLRLISDTGAVQILAEIGVALLLFTIGLEVSLKRLNKLKQIAFGGGSLQLASTIGITVGIMLALGQPTNVGIFWGFLVAVSSTAIVLKLLQERHEIDTVHGRGALGILVFQDLCVVPMMALLPVLAAHGSGNTLDVLWVLVRSLAVVGLIVAGAYWLFPKLLALVVLARSRELFVIATLFFAMGTAWGAAQFGLSLALGAFLAGIALSESEYGHQVMAEVLPFRAGLNSLFFISVGSLINLKFLWEHMGIVGVIAAAIVAVKLVTGTLAIVAVGFPLRVAALVGLGLAQVGEFSFILLQEAQRLTMIPQKRYQTFLAAAVVTMMATPGMISLGPRVSKWLGRKVEPRRGPLEPGERTEHLQDHVIVCGYGLNGKRTAALLRENNLPYMVLEMNARTVRTARSEGEEIYFGDVSNPEILRLAGVAQARAIVFAISDMTVLSRAISHARLLNANVHILARIKRVEDVRELKLAGATDVVAEELEAWMEIAVRVLRLYGMPREAIAAQIGKLREGDYDIQRILPLPGQPLRHLWHLLPEVDLELFVVLPGSALEGVALSELELRARAGAAVLAVVRDTSVVHNPPGDFRFQGGDQVVLIGSREQLGKAFAVLGDPGKGSE